jgi:branched-chain amino acid transport system permease protein
MTDFLQLFSSGLATGAIYALAALGFTLLWQASGTINFAQGEFVMLPAFFMLGFNMLGLPLLMSFLLSCLLAVFLLGWVFKRGVVDPLFKFGMMPIVVATIGLSIAMRNGIRAGYSAEAHPFASLFADKIYNVAGVTITLQDVGTFGLALALVLATQAFLMKTVTGRAMQAVAQNTESASVLGINVPRMIFTPLPSTPCWLCRRRCWSRPPTWPSSTWVSRWAPRLSSRPSSVGSTTRAVPCWAA